MPAANANCRIYPTTSLRRPFHLLFCVSPFHAFFLSNSMRGIFFCGCISHPFVRFFAFHYACSAIASLTLRRVAPLCTPGYWHTSYHVLFLFGVFVFLSPLA